MSEISSYSSHVSSDGTGQLTVVSDLGETVVFMSDNSRNFPRLLSEVVEGEMTYEEVIELAEDDAAFAAQTPIEDLTDRVTYDDGTVFLDGAEAPATFSDTVRRYRDEGRPCDGLVNFLERLDENPSRRSREQLFDWSSSNDLEIDQEGYLIGYKGIGHDDRSMHNGTDDVVVDGVVHTGRIPNHVGSVVQMDRSEVMDDPTVLCSNGLHVGNLSYARTFGRKLVTVRVDPAHVVSVPSDYYGQKMRVSQYEILDVVDTAANVREDYEASWDEVWEDEEVWDELVESIPESFLDKLRERLRRESTGKTVY